MTQKSASRRQRDANRRAEMGITSGKKTFDREKTSRCWYQLKEVHGRSQRSIEKLAELIAQYNHPVVLMKIAKNGDEAAFNAVQAKIPPAVAEMAKVFQELWDSHADKKKLCLSFEELQQAFRIFEAYQTFDIDLFNTFQPIIGELNVIYNKALGQLLEAQDELKLKMATEGGLPVSDVVLNEGDVPAQAQEVEAPKELGMDGISPDQKARGETSAIVQIDELGVVEESISVDPAVGRGLIHI